jgi:hypothetical protein
LPSAISSIRHAWRSAADLAQRLQYGMAMTKLAAQDPEVHRLTAEVSQLLKPQAALREPALAARVMSMM